MAHAEAESALHLIDLMDERKAAMKRAAMKRPAAATKAGCENSTFDRAVEVRRSQASDSGRVEGVDSVAPLQQDN